MRLLIVRGGLVGRELWEQSQGLEEWARGIRSPSSTRRHMIQKSLGRWNRNRVELSLIFASGIPGTDPYSDQEGHIPLTLRATFYEKLNEALISPNPNLRREDFSVTEGPSSLSGQKPSHQFELRVTYIYDTKYSFHFLFSPSQDGNFTGTVTMVPGIHLSSSSFETK